MFYLVLLSHLRAYVMLSSLAYFLCKCHFHVLLFGTAAYIVLLSLSHFCLLHLLVVLVACRFLKVCVVIRYYLLQR